ncbi:hypothetical protein NDU88_001529 [Pleurodeles waltl]|uniref:Uncharacterized protein n=1 Tax=Pleurodeles waltl TaxID=8319 RepID=A0AAV7R7E0_PLEWA|nr:hypothetical protein NDU88_001529 [Pleurodeles waltl]
MGLRCRTDNAPSSTPAPCRLSPGPPFAGSRGPRRGIPPPYVTPSKETHARVTAPRAPFMATCVNGTYHSIRRAGGCSARDEPASTKRSARCEAANLLPHTLRR